MTFTPSPYQQAIFDWYDAKHGNHLMVVARAGSGKTSTGIALANRLPIERLPRFAFVAFNRSIADELKTRLPKGANGMTYHLLLIL